jgi:hypothetical protein
LPVCFSTGEANWHGKSLFEGKRSSRKKVAENIQTRNSKLSVKTSQGLYFYRAEMFSLEAVAKFEPDISIIRHASYRL